ncbi:MAG TPA: phosphotransferase [Solirubrobacteraceae bacterium]|nr:phosphotransferase [Solirubrobacteraceae bacterium]
MSGNGDEVLLPGGYTNAGLVSRVGDTVRRPMRPSSPAVHALLHHLERVGFDGAPRVLGVDERGREVLSYIEGEAAIAPHQPWALTDEALISVAELLRRYHDAAASFDPSDRRWHRPVPAAFRDGLMCHNDPNLDNVVFTQGRAVALIDFDLAAPGSAAWDVACGGRLWAPLRDQVDVAPVLRGRGADRLRLFLDAYGMPQRDRPRVVDALLHAHDWCYDIVSAAVNRGHETFARMWREGGRGRAVRSHRWIAAHEPELRAAIGTSSQSGRSTAGVPCPPLP